MEINLTICIDLASGSFLLDMSISKLSSTNDMSKLLLFLCCGSNKFIHSFFFLKFWYVAYFILFFIPFSLSIRNYFLSLFVCAILYWDPICSTWSVSQKLWREKLMSAHLAYFGNPSIHRTELKIENTES